ncbi:NUDIX hydrolase [Eisenibacter elegans]|uniref:NUDIX hydrolase n=1 Tax=Eisenibacter elegans TaxID=997 RepID=UPI0003FA1DD4|nr:NUDIX domain-containing protein [Eisenibacter elegans]
MHIFIHETQINLYDIDDRQRLPKHDLWINMPEEALIYETLIGDVAICNASDLLIQVLLSAILQRRFPALHTLSLLVKHPRRVAKMIRAEFTLMHAAGGVARKGEQYLMIHRLGKWDLPKGKLEAGEKFKEAAVREVAEECGITVALGKKIATTWHYYTQDHTPILKKTNWYAMESVDEAALKPQTQEAIEEAVWMSKAEVKKALENSYRSIVFVMESYFEAISKRKSKP